LKLSHSVSATSKLQNQDDSEMIMNYEKRLSELMMTVQKQERDIAYKDEEIRAVKNVAREVAE
jgi:hypothetical protein